MNLCLLTLLTKHLQKQQKEKCKNKQTNKNNTQHNSLTILLANDKQHIPLLLIYQLVNTCTTHSAFIM